MRSVRSQWCLFSVLLLSFGARGQAQETPASPSLIDRFELSVEIQKHEQFIAARRREGAALAPFASDGCSGGMSAAWRIASSAFPVLAQRHGEHPPWEACCTAHDRLYHMGGALDADAQGSFAARRAADEQLHQCVIQVGDERVETLAAEYGLGQSEVKSIYRRVADVLYRAVRMGGAPCTGLPWRWGFGWPNC